MQLLDVRLDQGTFATCSLLIYSEWKLLAIQ
jgi:hypothetical protein